MATQTTATVYLPKTLLGPLARYMVEHDNPPLSTLLREALTEKLQREGYLSAD